MDEKQREAIRAKIVAEEKNKKYFKIGIIVGSVVLVLVILGLVGFVFLNKAKEQTAILNAPPAETSNVYGLEIKKTCADELNGFIKTSGVDYSKCLTEFNFNENFCGGFDPVNQGLANINMVVILDSSRSMTEEIDGQKRIDIAKQAISNFLSKMPQGVKTGLVVYGHKGSNSTADKSLSCSGIEEVVKLGENNNNNIISAMNSFSPKGWTPIAGAIDFAKNIFTNAGKNDKNYLILVSDGIESCNGNPLVAVNDLRLKVPNLTLNVIGFVTNSQAREALQEIAEWGGGKYIHADNSVAMSEALNKKLLTIQKDCLNATFSRMSSRYRINYLDNLNCWLAGQEKESKDFSLSNEKKSFSVDCSNEIYDALKARQNDFWNKKQALVDKNTEEYKKIEAEYKKNLEDILNKIN